MPQKKRVLRQKKPKKKRGLAMLLARYSFLGGIWIGVITFIYILYCAVDLPDIHQVTQPPLRPSVELESKDGTLFARYGDLVGESVSLPSLPKYVPQAIIAIEDRRFYDHFGIDIFGILRAAYHNIAAGRTVQGGSTLTQQLAKNLFLTPERAMKRKVQEMLLALWLEHTYTKDQILTAYLNRVYLGSGAYGIDAAAQTYFNKSAKELNIREAAMIAGLLRAPSRYSPLHDPAGSFERAKVVMQAMVEEGYISEAQRRVAVASAPKLDRKKLGGNAERYFADYVYDQLSSMIADTQQDMVVKTTLDLSLERLAERHVESVLSKQGEAKNVSEAALVTLAPDGAIRALTGGRSYAQSQYNRATQALRQPGSAFKPIIYLTAIEHGLTPDDIVTDEPVSIGKYSPDNYDGKFHGQMTARQALAESINTIAVKLLDQVGIGQVIQMAKDLGVSSPLSRNAALALGASEVSPLELATVYASLASGGKAIEPYAITKISSRSGQTLYRRQDGNLPQVVDADAVATLTGMMEDVIQYGTGKGANIGRPAAGKTGTTSDYRDAWFAGFTADYTTVVWMGNDDNSSTKKVTGGSLPAVLWREYMADAEQGLPVASLRNASFAQRVIDEAGEAVEDVGQTLGDLINSLVGNKVQ